MTVPPIWTGSSPFNVVIALPAATVGRPESAGVPVQPPGPQVPRPPATTITGALPSTHLAEGTPSAWPDDRRRITMSHELEPQCLRGRGHGEHSGGVLRRLAHRPRD